ncbi:hypothetical protein Tco_0162806, partial [Tanacetum coccineum]
MLAELSRRERDANIKPDPDLDIFMKGDPNDILRERAKLAANEMALPVQNINHSAFRSMFEKEKLSVAQLKLVLRVEKKMHVIEQPLPPAPEPVADPNVKQAGVEKFDLIQSFHACKQEEGKPVANYVLKMKGYVEKLKRLGYVLPQDVTVGLILNGLTKDFMGFVRNYNIHNMRRTIGEIHAML